VSGLTLYVDSDGSVGGTHVLVLGEDGQCLGELRHVTALDWNLAVSGGRAELKLRVLRVPGRYLADKDRVMLRMVGSRWRWLSNFIHRVRFGRRR
jgi:hypothetical protein